MVAYMAVMLTALVGFAGFAIDLQRSMLVQTRLKTAIDAAALAAARDFDSPDRDANARAAFAANLNPRGGANARNTVFGATVGAPIVQQVGDNQIRISASVQVPNTLFRVISTTPTTLNETSLASRQGTGLELSIVLDQTGSMGQRDNTLGITKIEAAKNAINTMLDVLYAGADTQANLWVALVPFARTINLGTGTDARNLLNTTAPSMPTGWDINAWTGCVEARQGGLDITDAGPQTLAGKFRPYFWASTWQAYGRVNSGQCQGNDAYPPYDTPQGSRRFCFADNDWGAPESLVRNNGSTVDYLTANPFYRNQRDAGISPPFGPNALCNLSPLMPLTASRRAVSDRVAAVTAPTRAGGTFIPVGLHGGWITLSPNWRGALPGATDALPLDYNTRNITKALVLLSDGDNNCFGAPQYGGGNVKPSDAGDELFYSAYGRLADGRLPVTRVAGNYGATQASADAALDDRTSRLCQAMKAAPYNIKIFVVGFELAQQSHRDLLRGCASSEAHFYESPSASALQSTFRRIGGQLANLRLSE